MNPARPPVYNKTFVAPADLDHSQVAPITAFAGEVPSGHNLDGAGFVVVAWKPTSEEIESLRQGGLIYISMLGGIPPHFVTTDFGQATYGRIIIE